jgi:sugar O-acyltransferase (sialic acid O-acetyltransferase NeuD family)
MLIVGAKGFAKEILEILYQLKMLKNVVFFDDVSGDLPEKLYAQFDILRNIEEVKYYFETVSNQFTLGVGNPVLRSKMYDKFVSIGGVFTSTVSPKASIGHFGIDIGEGCNIITGTVIDNSVILGEGCLLNTNSTIGHDSMIGAFVEICPGAIVSGRCTIGGYSFIGTNATILPKINVGCNTIVAAGSVVTQNIPDNCMVAGIPAIIKKELPELKFKKW